MAQKRTKKNLDNLFDENDSQAAGYFETEVPLSQCLPDRFQSRIILPLDIKQQFFNGEVDCYQAAANFLQAAEYDTGLQAQVSSLLDLGESILELGQIEPATGAWVQQEGGHVFAIEVGERRFWSLALMAVQHQLPQEPTLRVIEESHFSRERQIAENIQREGNTAVDRARAIAGLILLRLDIHPEPEMVDDLDYFRQVLKVKRLPSNTWPPLEKQMSLSRPVMERHLQILKLSNELVYLAKLYDVPEGRLREIIASPKNVQKEMLLLAIKENLTARELREHVEQQKPNRGPRRKTGLSTYSRAASRLRSFLKLARRRDFSEGYEPVAVEFSADAQNAEELIEVAEHLEEQAHWLRVMYDRRQ
jgi:ParB-like chromosome segregation protein Spo0J